MAPSIQRRRRVFYKTIKHLTKIIIMILITTESLLLLLLYAKENV